MIQLKIKILVIFTFLFCSACCHNVSVADIKLRTKVLTKIYMGLFIYYIDNKKFPSTEDGMLYGLLKTGKNPPYYLPSLDEAFSRKLILRRDQKTMIESEEEIQQGDIYLSPMRVPYHYYSLSKDSFSLEYRSDEQFLKKYGWINPVLKFENLPYLRYKKISEMENGSIAWALCKSDALKFYLEKSIEKSTDKEKEGKPLEKEKKSK